MALRQIGASMTDIFDFISDDAFRESLRSDYAEINRAFESRSWKTVLVLCGSIVETIMVDYLLQTDCDAELHNQIIKMSFADIIKTMAAKNVISDTSRDLASVVRNYRNLIHPGRQLRLNQAPTMESANIARSLVHLISNEIATTLRQNQGLTADQLVSKLERDPSASNLIKHYTKRMSENELRKFVVVSAPERFFQLEETIELIGSHDETDSMLRTQKALRSSYHSVLRVLSDQSKSTAAEHFVSILNDGSESFVNAFTENFFSPSLLSFLTVQQRDYVEDYVLSRFQTVTSLVFFQRMRALGHFISDEKFHVFVWTLVPKYLHAADRNAKELLHDMLLQCLSMQNEKRVAETKGCIESWARRQRSEDVRQELLSIIKNAEDIPF